MEMGTIRTKVSRSHSEDYRYLLYLGVCPYLNHPSSDNGAQRGAVLVDNVQ